MSEATEIAAPGPAPARSLAGLAGEHGTTLLVAAVVFLVAYDNGGFGEPTRDALGIVLAWAAILAIGIGLWPLVRMTRAAVLTGSLLAAFAGFTLLSVTWASSAEGAYTQFSRALVYLTIFGVAVLAGRRENLERWADGLALGITAIVVLALVSRLFPHLVANRAVVRLLPAAEGRLSYPIGYWNGLGIFAGMGIPLLLRLAVGSRRSLVRGFAVAPLPAFVSVIYLTSSRGGIAAAVFGGIAFFLFTARRWAVAAAGLAAGLSSVAAVLVLVDRPELVNEPLSSGLAERQGQSATLIIGGICLLTALVYGGGSRLVPDGVRPSPVLGWLLVIIAVALAGIGIVAAHPQKRFQEFKRPPGSTPVGGTVEQHLLSANGSGRWQLWHSAFEEFKSKPVLGRGAGSFQAWWAQHGTITAFVQDAHSLYLETLGDLGIVGFILLVAALGSGIVTALGRLVRVRDVERVGLAAVTASFIAFLVGAGADWMWQLTAVSGVAFVCLGLITGPTTVPASHFRALIERPRRFLGWRATSVAGGCLLICALAVPLLAGVKLRASQDAVGRGNARAALHDALDAKSIQPWASSPYVQLALLEEQAGHLRSARRWIRESVSRDPADWRLWLIQARIQTKLGLIGPALRSLDRARSLNPRSALFHGT